MVHDGLLVPRDRHSVVNGWTWLLRVGNARNNDVAGIEATARAPCTAINIATVRLARTYAAQTHAHPQTANSKTIRETAAKLKEQMHSRC